MIWLPGFFSAQRSSSDKSLPIIEIDVVEQYGHWPNKLTTAVHEWNRGGGPSKHLGVRHIVDAMTSDFHNYGVVVTQQFIAFFFDGVEIRRDKTPESAKTPLYIMAELALGPGWPLDQTPSPSYMYVDYIRAYSK
jgi:beta-glucanase (GH16 family)